MPPELPVRMIRWSRMFLIATLPSVTVAVGEISQTATIYQTATGRLKQIRGKMRKVAGELTDFPAHAVQLAKAALTNLWGELIGFKRS
jgi:hypothetical protein